MTPSDQLQHTGPVFMLVRRTFLAYHLYPSDTLRHGQMPVGMAGLRHKPRHKFKATKHTTLDTPLLASSRRSGMFRPAERVPGSRGMGLSNRTPSQLLSFRKNIFTNFVNFRFFTAVAPNV
jgi:hypothetical protein